MYSRTAVMPASCDRCRLKRVKCDRQQPCANCHRRNTECIVSTTTARPRGREGGRKSKKSRELQERIEKLEALVDAASASTQGLPGTSLRRITEQGSDNDEALVAKDSKLYQYAAGPVWSQLSSQIEGLREILLDSDDDISKTPDTQSSVICDESSEPEYYQSMLLCNGSGIRVSDLNSIEHPPPLIREKLLTVYEQNVDPLCRVFHKPTLRSYMATVKTSALVNPEEAEKHATLFAMYGAAILSMTDDSLNLLLSSPRNVVLRRFCFAIEYYLTKADYLNSCRTGPLQALIVYLLIIRFLEPGQKHWILIGLAVQLARGLSLHSAKSIQNYSPLQHELRCRLWHTLRIIDFRAALDRGTEVVIGLDSFDTPLPRNLNDEDLFEHQVKLPDERSDITDMTLALLGYEGTTVMVELYHVKSTHLDRDNPSNVWIYRQKAATNLEQRLKERYAKFCNESHPLHWMLNYIIDIMATLCQLLAIRPISHIKDSSLPLPLVDSQCILEKSIISLREEERFFTTEAARGFTWFYWVHWYVLAVALVELSASPSPLLDDSIWSTISGAYDRQSHLVADTSYGSLWKPVKKLMSKVQQLRHSMISSKARKEAESSLRIAPTNEYHVTVPTIDGLQIGSNESASWTFVVNQKQNDTNPIQTEFLHTDSGMLEPVDPFIHWDTFLDGMNDIDPFTFWTPSG